MLLRRSVPSGPVAAPVPSVRRPAPRASSMWVSMSAIRTACAGKTPRGCGATRPIAGTVAG